MDALLLELADGEAGRERRGEAALAHPLELIGYLALELVEGRCAGTVVLELCAQHDDRVARPPFIELALRAVCARIAARMPDEAVGQRLDECGALA